MFNILKRIEEAKIEKEKQRQIELEKERRESTIAFLCLIAMVVIGFIVLGILNINENKRKKEAELAKQQKEMRIQAEYREVLALENYGYDFDCTMYYNRNIGATYYLIDFDRLVQTVVVVKYKKHRHADTTHTVSVESYKLEKSEDGSFIDKSGNRFYILDEPDKKEVKILYEDGERKTTRYNYAGLADRFLEEYFKKNDETKKREVLVLG